MEGKGKGKKWCPYAVATGDMRGRSRGENMRLIEHDVKYMKAQIYELMECKIDTGS
jgi:hypothetical protein